MNSLVETYQAKYSTEIAEHQIRRSKYSNMLFEIVAVNSSGEVLSTYDVLYGFEDAVEAVENLNSELHKSNKEKV